MKRPRGSAVFEWRKMTGEAVIIPEGWASHPWGQGLVTPTTGRFAGSVMHPGSALAELLGYPQERG